ncbi:MAG: hypothetical protein GOP50_12905 [Candidatus Heimdallarchaeota archaeon]|nr:hypothetical protein [Candidatus Heimdallarchaeota archaeon]
MNEVKSPKASETRTDFRVSWQLFKSNYKAFIATEIFAILAFIIINAIIIGIIVLVFYLSPNLSIADLHPKTASDESITFRVYGFIAVLAYLTMTGFLYCQYGLAYDILSSGDMFTEFKKVFSYFKNHWWKYMLLIIVTGFGYFLPVGRIGEDPPRPLSDQAEIVSIILMVARVIGLFVLLVLFSSTLPSVTSQGNLKNSFIESIRIVKKDSKRLVKTWGLYFLIFTLPIFALSFTLVLIMPLIKGSIWVIIIMVIIAILYFINLFIGFPMMSLIATRIYNTVDFERFKPLVEDNKKRQYI